MADLGIPTELNGSGAAPPAIPDHELLRRIGRGSYGEVWLARSALGHLRAVKIVHRSSFTEDRPYEREFTGLRNFEPLSRAHEGFVDILQIGRNDDAGFFYYVMELADDGGQALSPKTKSQSAAVQPRQQLPGTPGLDVGAQTFDCRKFAPLTLESRIRNEGRLPVKECVRIAATLADALRFLHGAGLVHRDIKPSNIIFVVGVPKLADVGLVAQADSARTFVGTEGFFPPEGPGTPRADIYSLGKCLYEMAMGKDRQAFPSPPTQLDALPDRAELLELNEVITKACEPDVSRRYQSATAFGKDLADLAQGRSLRAATSRRKRAGQIVAIGVVAAVLAALVALVKNLSHRNEATGTPPIATATSALRPLVLMNSFRIPTNSNVTPEGVVDLENDGLARVLVRGPGRQLSLRSPDGSVVASVELPPGAVAEDAAALVARAEPNRPKNIFLGWHDATNVYIGCFDSQLRMARDFGPITLHLEDSKEMPYTYFFPYGLRRATPGSPPQLLARLQGRRRDWPREFRCYNATNATLLWTNPYAAVASLSPPIADPGLGGDIAWIIGAHACANGFELLDGESDENSYVRALTADGRQRWRTNTGEVFTHAHPRLVPLPEGNAVFVFVQRAHDVCWQWNYSNPGEKLTPVGKILRLGPEGQQLSPMDVSPQVELTGLEACDVDGDGRPEILAPDGQGTLHVFDTDLNFKRVVHIASPPVSTSHRTELFLAPPADLDGDGQPELVFLHEDVEHIESTNFGSDNATMVRKCRNATIVVYDHLLQRPRAQQVVAPETRNGILQLAVTPRLRDGTRQIVVFSPTEVRFYRYAP